MTTRIQPHLIAYSIFLMLVGYAHFTGCADDIKGEQGEIGQPGVDATADAIISFRRPGFTSRPGNPKAVVVPATKTQVAQVYVSGVVYTNTADAAADLLKIGRNGLDTGVAVANTVYYLYAVPQEADSGFDLIASLSDPSIGPTDFQAHSYLGAFMTDDSANVPAFRSEGGRFQANFVLSAISHTGDDNNTQKSIPMPLTAHASIGDLSVSGPTLDRHGYANGWGITSSSKDPFLTTTTAANIRIRNFVVIPLEQPGTIYLRTTEPTNIVYYEHSGWIENVTLWN